MRHVNERQKEAWEVEQERCDGGEGEGMVDQQQKICDAN